LQVSDLGERRAPQSAHTGEVGVTREMLVASPEEVFPEPSFASQRDWELSLVVLSGDDRAMVRATAPPEEIFLGCGWRDDQRILAVGERSR
jgi:hypothetical protein